MPRVDIDQYVDPIALQYEVIELRKTIKKLTANTNGNRPNNDNSSNNPNVLEWMQDSKNRLIESEDALKKSSYTNTTLTVEITELKRRCSYLELEFSEKETLMLKNSKLKTEISKLHDIIQTKNTKITEYHARIQDLGKDLKLSRAHVTNLAQQSKKQSSNHEQGLKRMEGCMEGLRNENVALREEILSGQEKCGAAIASMEMMKHVQHDTLSSIQLIKSYIMKNKGVVVSKKKENGDNSQMIQNERSSVLRAEISSAKQHPSVGATVGLSSHSSSSHAGSIPNCSKQHLLRAFSTTSGSFHSKTAAVASPNDLSTMQKIKHSLTSCMPMNL